MLLPLVDLRRAAEMLRRHGAIAILAASVIVAFAVLAAIGAGDRRSAEARVAELAVVNAVDRAHALLDHQQRGLDELARIAATQPDAAAQQFLDRLPALAQGIRGAALTDAAGTVQLRSGAGLDETALAALGADAAKEAAAHPDATLLVTQTVRDGDAPLIGLARPWRDGEGQLDGVALVALDPTAFAGLDLVRKDGSPLFAETAMAGVRQVALGDLPLALSYPPADAVSVLEAPFVAIAVVGVMAIMGLLTLLIGRVGAAKREIARQVVAERELRQELSVAAAAADRIDEVSRTKSQFFAQVTHELRTPLNAILGFSETIRQEMFGPVANARYLEYAGLIHDAGAHLLSLINDLLDNARIEAGKMEIAPIRVSAPALARSALDLVELLAEGRDIAVATTGLSSCPDLNIDPRAMKQVLVNLLSNAIKYTSPGGRIDLRFAARDDGGAAIEITDTGIGMSAEDIRVAFEPFGRANAIAARRQQGSGLGLSLARALVRLHGGELTLTSRLDCGTTATLVLPASAVFGLASAPPKTARSETSAKAA